MSTVFPTPAPPKSPTFPPLINGTKRSITLIPVSNTSVTEDWSLNFGGSRWIDHLSSPFASPSPSIGSPTTSNILPRTFSPTATEIGAPVSVTSSPRFSPSVLFIAIHRTCLSPKCCATSSVMLVFSFSGFATVRAFLIDGSPSLNSTSTTVPITCEILPFIIVVDNFDNIFNALPRYRS